MLRQHQKASASGPDGSGGDERSSARVHHEDPYNQVSGRLAAEEALAGRQLAYDSMSTILEVDSEGSESSSLAERRLDPREVLRMEEPLRVRTAHSSHPYHQATSSEKTPEDSQQQPVSPVGVKKDTLSGTLSALALQVEKLRRSSAEPQDAPVASTLDEGSAQEKELQDNRYSATPTQQRLDEGLLSPLESLMMITISPTPQPMPDSRLESSPGGELEAGRVVEVSNKSTITAIDLQLMDQMVERFFVQTREKGTQSIEFDCEPPERLISGAGTGTGAGSGKGKRKETKSVAVGTEKFSRQRFSLLPPTSTRATQTNSALDHQDIGTSETRRFKLNHLQIQPVRRLTRTSPPALIEESMDTTQGQRLDSATKSPGELSDSLAWDASKMDAPADGAAKESAAEDSLNEPKQMVDEQVDNEEGEECLSNSDSLKVTEEEKEQRPVNGSKSPLSGNLTSLSQKKEDTPALDKQQEQTGEPMALPEAPKSNGSVSQENSAPIPSVKTELRVIIELKDSRRRQVSELKSSSQVNNSRVSRSTEVSSSRYVSSSPNQVLEKLNLVGQRHSLMLNGRARISTSPATNQSFLKSAGSSPSLAQTAASEPPVRHWCQVSNSSVRNVIEAPGPGLKPAGAGGKPGSQVTTVLSSEAELVERGNEVGAIELSQRALRRTRTLDGKESERTLVESQASFDEPKPVGEQFAKPFPVDISTSSTASRSGARKEGVSSGVAEKAVLPQPSLTRAGRRMDERRAPRPAASYERLNLRTDSAASHRSIASSSPLRPHPNLHPQHHQQHHQQQQQQTKRQQQLDIHEEREERRQLTKNGKLVFDDRLRERHFESQSVSPADAEPHFRSEQTRARQHQQHQRAARTPTPVERVIQQQRQLAGGVGDLQTTGGSLLSSDPETMDSGFGAQSGVGSGLNVASRRSPYQQQQQQPRHQQHQNRAPPPQSRLERQLADSGESLNFVDDDTADELMDELDGSSRRPAPAPVRQPAARPAPISLAKKPPIDGQFTTSSPNKHRFMEEDSGEERAASLLIEPPAAFSCTNLDTVGLGHPREALEKQPKAELSTCLTRTQRPLGAKAEPETRTRTRLDQNVMGTGSWLRSQVTFESDTDSAAERHSSAAESSAEGGGRGRKELVSETQLEIHKKSGEATEPGEMPGGDAEVRRGQVKISSVGEQRKGLWDYSLRVNRMRGSKVDSRAK